MLDLLLGPLGLGNTLLAHDAVLARPYADGHYAATFDGEPALAILTPLRLPRAMDPAGGIWSTTRDLIRYARFHFGVGSRGGPARVVQPESLARMQEPAIALPGVSMAMGRSWFVQDIAGLRVIAHAGETNGHFTRFVAISDRDVAIVVLTNNGDGGNPAVDAVVEAVWTHYPGLAALSERFGFDAQWLVPPETPTRTLTPAQLAAYTGRYADPDQTLIVTVRDGVLELTYEPGPPPPVAPVAKAPPAPPTPLAFIAEDVAAWDGFRLPFVRDADGVVQGVAVSLWFVPRVGEEPGG